MLVEYEKGIQNLNIIKPKPQVSQEERSKSVRNNQEINRGKHRS